MKGRDSNYTRTIKFKAKRLDSDEWVEGDLGHSASLNKGVQTYKTTISTPIYTDHGEILGHSVYEVDPSTVCQFIGMKDESGKEIWEHDIVYIVLAYVLSGEVIYDKEKGSFVVVPDEESSEYYERNVSFVKIEEMNSIEESVEMKVLYSKFDRKGGEK